MLEGPALATLTRRLAETPPDFFAQPYCGGRGIVHLAAVVSDLLLDLGGEPPPADRLQNFQAVGDVRLQNWQRLVLISCWLLHDEAFVQPQNLAPAAFDFLRNRLPGLAKHHPALKFTSDPERREELARQCLKALGLLPAGETVEQAEDRLAAIDSGERQRLMSAARKAEERTRAILEAIASQRAQESANKMNRE